MALTIKSFEETIKAYLDNHAKKDELFAITYAKPNKSIDECCKYIMQEVKKAIKGNCGAVADDEVYALAIHYYDEDDIKVESNAPKAQVSHTPAPAATPAPKNKGGRPKKTAPAPEKPATIQDDELPEDLIIPIF